MTFILRLMLYALGTILSLLIALSPLTFYLYFIYQNGNLFLFITLPILVPVLWLSCFFLYVILHAKIVTRLALPEIQRGNYALRSLQTVYIRYDYPVQINLIYDG